MRSVVSTATIPSCCRWSKWSFGLAAAISLEEIKISLAVKDKFEQRSL